VSFLFPFLFTVHFPISIASFSSPILLPRHPRNQIGDRSISFNFVLYLVVNAQFRSAVAEACRCPTALVGPCCRKPPNLTTTELIELACPLTAGTGGGGSVTSPRDGHHDRTFSALAVDVDHHLHRRRYDEDNDGQRVC